MKNKLALSGLELARKMWVPGTRRNSEHHLWHPRTLRFLILNGTRRAHSMYLTSALSVLYFQKTSKNPQFQIANSSPILNTYMLK